jgi:hypothetical protein
MLPDEILCVDTYKAFQEFFNDKVRQQNQIACPNETPDQSSKMFKKDNDEILLDDSWNKVLFSCLDHFDKVQRNENEHALQTSKHNKKNEFNINVDTGFNNNQEINCFNSSLNESNSLKLLQQINEKTPNNQIIKNSYLHTRNITYKNLESVKRHLDFNNCMPKNFKLSTVYIHMIGQEARNLHCAEADCIAMLQCVCQMGTYFVEWADHNAISLNLIKKEN